jgi:hypothetical protein
MKFLSCFRYLFFISKTGKNKVQSGMIKIQNGSKSIPPAAAVNSSISNSTRTRTNINGISPAIKANDVINIGQTRAEAPSIAA